MNGSCSETIAVSKGLEAESVVKVELGSGAKGVGSSADKRQGKVRQDEGVCIELLKLPR